jgi:hypothetical protein
MSKEKRRALLARMRKLESLSGEKLAHRSEIAMQQSVSIKIFGYKEDMVQVHPIWNAGTMSISFFTFLLSLLVSFRPLSSFSLLLVLPLLEEE